MVLKFPLRCCRLLRTPSLFSAVDSRCVTLLPILTYDAAESLLVYLG